MSTALLSFEHVAFGYTPARQIFTDLNYQLRRGTLTVILGPNEIGNHVLYMALGCCGLQPGGCCWKTVHWTRTPARNWAEESRLCRRRNASRIPTR